MNWFDVLNKGVPESKNVALTVDVVGDNCCTDKTKYVERLRDDLYAVNSNLSKKFGLTFLMPKGLMTVVLNDKLEQCLTFSPSNFIIRVLELLNDKITYEDEFNNEILIKRARERIKVLSKIKLPSKLESEFPMLYEEYTELENVQKQYNDFKKRALVARKMGMINESAYDEQVKKFNMILGKYGFDKKTVNIQSFVEFMSKQFSGYLKPDTYNQILEEIASYQIDIESYDDCLDKNKFEFMLAASYLSTAYGTFENRTSNISYVTQFFKENIDNMDDPTTISLAMRDEEEVKEKVITKKDLYDMYKKFLVLHPEVKLARKNINDFSGCTYEDVEAYLKQFDEELSVSWDILANPNSLFENSKGPRALGSVGLSEDEKSKKLENKQRILEEKEEFFKNNKPYLVLRGKDAFTGYIGYIYPNAYVVLEKFFNNKNGTSIAEDAIYIMNVEDFVELSVLSKGAIISGGLCDRVTHHKGWQDKVSKFIEDEPSIESIERVQRFENQIKLLNK